MESVSGTASPPPQIDLSDYSSVVQELQSLRRSYDELQSRHSAVTKQRGELLKRNSDLEISVEETSLERDLLYDLIRQLDVFCKEKQSEIERMMFDEMSTRKGLETEVEISRQRIEQLESEIRDKESQSEFILTSLLNDLREIISHFEDSKSERISVEEADDESRLNSIRRLASEVEAKVDECKKRKKGLEDRIMSLTEENRDLNSLLRAALMEKEAAARNLKELKGNNEQKSFALLQIAERGLQKFGFIIGSSSSEHTVEDSEPSSNEEEIVTLASTVERVTKNLRLEITQLRRSLEDSRSDCERLQSLVDKQAQKIAENALYIQQLEDRERALAQHVEELTEEIKEAEVEAGRWMEACELEVEAGVILIVGILLLSAMIFEAYRRRNNKHIDRPAFFEDPNSLKQIPSPHLIDPAEKYISLIIPAFNEEHRLPAALDETINYLQQRASKDRSFTYEVLIVDDGSADATKRVAFDFVGKYSVDNVRVILLGQNHGKGQAIRKGMLHSRGELLLMLDADGATKVTDLEKLEQKILAVANAEDTEDGKSGFRIGDMPVVAFGSRAHLEEKALASRKWYRNFLMKGFHLVVLLAAGPGIRDTQCGFKMFTRAAARKLFANIRLKRWCLDVELVFLCKWFGIPMFEISVSWSEIPGSKVNLLSIPNMLWELALMSVGYRTGMWKISS